MNKVFLIIKREYLERVKSKWFLIGTLLGPLMMSAMVLVPILIQKFSSPNRTIALVDAAKDPELCKSIEKKLAEKTDRGTFKIRMETASDEAAQKSTQERLSKEVEDGNIQGYLVIGSETVSKGKVDYYAKNVSDFAANRQLENVVTDAVVEKRLSLAGMDAARVAELSKRVDLKTNKLLAGGSQEDSGQSFFLSLVMLLMIYMMTLLYGITVMRGVIEEKQSRIVEVIISAISPTQLMFGKIIGIGLVGLTQVTIWMICAAALPGALAATALASNMTLPAIPASLLIYFGIYFILGYFLFASLYAMVGSMVSNEQDANNVQMPVTMLLVVPMLLWTMVLRDPSSTVSTILSLVPFFTPMLMFLRITVQTPPFWQIALSIVLMLGAIMLCSWIGGKIYRVGILMYGKRPNLPELVKWLRYT